MSASSCTSSPARRCRCSTTTTRTRPSSSPAAASSCRSRRTGRWSRSGLEEGESYHVTPGTRHRMVAGASRLRSLRGLHAGARGCGPPGRPLWQILSRQRLAGLRSRLLARAGAPDRRSAAPPRCPMRWRCRRSRRARPRPRPPKTQGEDPVAHAAAADRRRHRQRRSPAAAGTEESRRRPRSEERERRAQAGKPVAVIDNRNLAEFSKGQKLTVAEGGGATAAEATTAQAVGEAVAQRRRATRPTGGIAGSRSARRWRESADRIVELEGQVRGAAAAVLRRRRSVHARFADQARVGPHSRRARLRPGARWSARSSSSSAS